MSSLGQYVANYISEYKFDAVGILKKLCTNLKFCAENLDIFTHTQSLGKSRKNNLISTRYIKDEIHMGGVLLALQNLEQYFNKVDFLCLIYAYIKYCINEN